MGADPASPLRVLFVGPEFHGSVSGALARAFRRLGHLVQHVDPDRIFPPTLHSKTLKAARKGLRGLFVRELGKQIVRQAQCFRPHFALVCKGQLVAPWALEELKRQKIYLVNFYPDVSFMCHGPLIPQCLPLYDRIFMTKTFGIDDLDRRLGVTDVEFLPHGFDPDLHRELSPTAGDRERLGADAAFIGTWSPKKERFLEHAARALPDVRLRVWGGQWERSHSPDLAPCVAGQPITGDIYSLTIQCTAINIAILSEARAGSSSGDLTTSRTFEIPACGGFMLHERTDELLEFFREGEEVACFADPEELAEKIEHHLNRPEEREAIRLAGRRRCLAEDSLDRRAQRIVDRYRERHV